MKNAIFNFNLGCALLALALAGGACRRQPHAPVPPAAPPTPQAAATLTATGALAAAADVETPARPLPPRNGTLSQLDQIRWQMHDNVKELVALAKQRAQRESALRAQDAETQRLFAAGDAQRDAYRARIAQDAKLQELESQIQTLHQRQRDWAAMCRQLEKGNAAP
jgi:hypothetical protein